jgi:hypothetical protein
MGFAAPLMMIAGTGLGAYSTYRQGLAASEQAKAQAQMSFRNAQIAEANATARDQKTTFDQVRALKHGRRILGKLRTKLAKGGAVMTEGAPSDVVDAQEAENAFSVAMIGHRGMVEAGKQRSMADAYRAETENYYTTASNLETAGKMGAGVSLLEGFGTVSTMGAWPKPLNFFNIT